MAYKMKNPTAMMEKGPMATSAERYDAKKAYDKNLTASARMHYLENDIADKKGPKASQGYNDRLDESLGSKNGKKSQSMKSRRDESEGMEESKERGKFSGNKSSSPTAYKKGPKAMKKDGAMAFEKGPMAYSSSADKVHGYRKGVTAMMEKKGVMAMGFDSTTDKGIKGLGSSNKSGGKYI